MTLKPVFMLGATLLATLPLAAKETTWKNEAKIAEITFLKDVNPDVEKGKFTLTPKGVTVVHGDKVLTNDKLVQIDAATNHKNSVDLKLKPGSQLELMPFGVMARKFTVKIAGKSFNFKVSYDGTKFSTVYQGAATLPVKDYVDIDPDGGLVIHEKK